MEKPKVGLAVIVMKENKVLLGKRKGAHGEGTWSFPGGHLELFEEFEDCAERELEEEVGEDFKVSLIDRFPVAVTNDFFKKEKKHYVTLFMRAKYVSGEPKIMEPEKCERWCWYDWYGGIPLDVFIPISNLITKQNYDPFKK